MRCRAIGTSGVLRLVGLVLLGVLGACASPSSQTPAGGSPPATAAPAAAPTAALAPAASTAAPSAATAVPVSRLRLAVPAKSLVFLPYYFGQERGLFTAQGIDLDIVVMQPSTGIAAVVSGEVEYTAASGSSLSAGLAGAPLRNVMFVMGDMLFGLYARPEVRAISGLAGGAVGVTNRYATDDYALAALLRHGGVADDQVSRVSTGTAANSFTALLAGGLTGAVLSPPYAELAERDGMSYLGYAADVLRREQSGLATTQQRIAQQPEQVKRMIRATLDSIVYVQDHPQDATEFVTRSFELDPAMAASATAKALKALVRDGKMPAEVTDATAEDIAAAQGLQNAPRGSSLLENRLLDEVLAESARRS